MEKLEIEFNESLSDGTLKRIALRALFFMAPEQIGKRFKIQRFNNLVDVNCHKLWGFKGWKRNQNCSYFHRMINSDGGLYGPREKERGAEAKAEERQWRRDEGVRAALVSFFIINFTYISEFDFHPFILLCLTFMFEWFNISLNFKIMNMGYILRNWYFFKYVFLKIMH